MTSPTIRIRDGARRSVWTAFALLASAAAGASSSPAQTEAGGRAAGAAGVIAPATAVMRTGTARIAQKPKAEPKLGRITGKLTDAATGEALIGGQIAVKGYPLGNVSDDAGVYFINNVPLGAQTLSVEYLGYEPQSREHAVVAGNGNTADFALNPTAIALDEIVVEEAAVRDLSEYVAKTAPPAFEPVPLRQVAVEKPDTTLMEDWHGAWKNYSALHSIEYPMMGERVYFRRPVKAPTGRAEPAARAPAPADWARGSKPVPAGAPPLGAAAAEKSAPPAPLRAGQLASQSAQPVPAPRSR